MSNYRQEMRQLVIELLEQSTVIRSDEIDKTAKLQRQAEVLGFIIEHPEDFIENIKQNEGHDGTG